MSKKMTTTRALVIAIFTPQLLSPTLRRVYPGFDLLPCGGGAPHTHARARTHTHTQTHTHNTTPTVTDYEQSDASVGVAITCFVYIATHFADLDTGDTSDFPSPSDASAQTTPREQAPLRRESERERENTIDQAPRARQAMGHQGCSKSNKQKSWMVWRSHGREIHILARILLACQPSPYPLTRL